jgi:hypothetical protein
MRIIQLGEINKRDTDDSPNVKKVLKKSFHRRCIEGEMMCSNEQGRRKLCCLGNWNNLLIIEENTYYPKSENHVYSCRRSLEFWLQTNSRLERESRQRKLLLLSPKQSKKLQNRVSVPRRTFCDFHRLSKQTL